MHPSMLPLPSQPLHLPTPPIPLPSFMEAGLPDYWIFFADLGRMYSLVQRVPIGMTELRRKFQSHVHSQGLSAIEKCGDAVINVSQEGISIYVIIFVIHWPLLSISQEPKLYVQALLEEYNKYHLMVSTSFNGDSGFLQALDKVLGKKTDTVQ